MVRRFPKAPGARPPEVVQRAAGATMLLEEIEVRAGARGRGGAGVVVGGQLSWSKTSRPSEVEETVLGA